MYLPHHLPHLLKKAETERREAEQQVTNTILVANVQTEALNTLIEQVHDKELEISLMIRSIHSDLIVLSTLKKQMYATRAKSEAGSILLNEIKSSICSMEEELDKLISYDTLDLSNRLYGGSSG